MSVLNEILSFIRTNFTASKLIDVEHDGVKTQLICAPTRAGDRFLSVVPYTEQARVTPKRRDGVAMLTSEASFIEHVNRHKGEHSVVFSDQDDCRFTCVYDYHHSGADGQADWCVHQSKFLVQRSRQLEAWQFVNEKPFTQPEFAEFIERRILDIGRPENIQESTKKLLEGLPAVSIASAAKLMEISRHCKVHVNSQVHSAYDVSTGEAIISFEQEHKKTDSTKVPNVILLSIPLVKGGPLYQVPALLRYRANGGKLTWWVDLQRIEELWEHAWSASKAEIESKTGLTVFDGQPESRPMGAGDESESLPYPCD